MLRVIVENKLTKIFYMDRLFSKSPQSALKIDMESIINDIVNKSTEFLLSEDLKQSLKEFLPEYFEYLAYKIETKREITEVYDKLEGIIWQNIADIVQSESPEDLEQQYEARVEKIDREIEQNPENLELYYLKIQTLIYFNQYQAALKLLDTLLEVFPESEKDIDLLKVVVHRRTHNIETGLKIINKLIEKFPEDNDLLCYKAYWMYYLDEKEEAFKLIQDLIKKEPENGMFHDTYGEILMYFEEYEEAVKRFLKAMVIGIDDWYIYQTYIKLGICYKSLANYDLALKNLKEGKNLANKSTSDPETKQKWIAISDLFLSEIDIS
jgi:tetratricopeptide (TPR) repeat protein